MLFYHNGEKRVVQKFHRHKGGLSNNSATCSVFQLNLIPCRSILGFSPALGVIFLSQPPLISTARTKGYCSRGDGANANQKHNVQENTDLCLSFSVQLSSNQR